MLQVLGTYDAHNPLALDDVAARFPTLRATSPHASRSDKYAHISTYDALRQLTAEGFNIHGVQVQRVKPGSGRFGWEKHLIRMRRPGTELTKVGDVVPEILLRHAHDGTASYELSAGMLRFVCLNGLVVGSTWGVVRVRHSGRDVGPKVIDATYRVVGEFSRLAGAIETWRGIELSRDEQHAFAEQAFSLRYAADAETGTTRAPITPYALADNVRRVDDAASNLWTVYNRVQENLTRGGIRGHVLGANGRMRRASTRNLTAIDSSLRVNRGLFDLAERWSHDKAPALVSDRAAFSRVADDAEVIAA
jgi:hypothetical protein